MSDLFYRNPRLLALTLMLIAVMGLSAIKVLPRAEDPELVSRNAIVFTPFPGASAERVEALVTDPIEDAMAQFEELKELTSTSRAGFSTVTLELADEIADVDEVWSRIRDEIAEVGSQLPASAGTPDFDEFTITAYSTITGLTWELPGEPNHAILRRLAEQLADRLRALPGTEDADLFGHVDEEILVEVEPAKLASFGLTVAEVALAIENADSKVPAGAIRSSATNLLIEVDGALDSLERIAHLPILRGAEGRFLRLVDVGTVTKSWVQPVNRLALVSGNAGVVVAARMQSGRRIDTWSDSARDVIEVFRESLPRGVGLTMVFDQSPYTEGRLAELVGNLVVGALLVMLVVFFTMGWRSALIVGAALPLTTLMVLQGMRMLGIPMHQMSIAGLIIALGLLIDNAIVMTDEVRHKLDSGHRISAAIRESVHALAIPLLGSTFTTVLAFMPIVLMPGGAGEFVGPMAVSVILAIVSSLFLSLTVTPAFVGLFERYTKRRTRRTLLSHGLSNARIEGWYRQVLGLLFRHPFVAVLLALILPVVGFVQAGKLEEQFFPPADRDQFQIELRLPLHASLSDTRSLAEQARELLLEHEAVTQVHWFVGESAPKFYYNFIEGSRDAPYYAQGLVQLARAEGSLGVIREVQERLDREYPAARWLAKQIEQGPPFEAPIEMRLFGPDLSVLRAEGEALRGILAEVAGVTHARASLESGRPKLALDIDEEAAHLLGFGNVELATLLSASLEGIRGGSLLEATEELPVRVRLAGAERADLARISNFDLPRPGGWAPLSAVAEFELRPEVSTIPHWNSERCNTVQGFVTAGLLPNVVLERLQLKLEGYELPPGYRLAFGGEAAERDEAVGNLAATAGILLTLMAASLVLSFNSFRMAFLIAGVGLLSVGLSFLALSIFGHPFGFMAIVGTMGLIGVAINDSIVVLAGLRQSEKALAGDVTAVVDVVHRSTRHVLSTSLTTMAGFAPLILGGGGFWPPVAVAIGGGVAGATLLALTFIPAGFMLAICRRRRPKAQGPASAPALPAPA